MPVSTATPLTVLHTSDWHLGRRLYGRMRYEEFEAFLAWLYDTITTRQVDVLIVAGDIFDTMTPSNRAQNLYYDFLGKVSKTCCQHIVVVAGNHDSPTFLDAPNQVLKFLNVHVIGMACEDLNDEVLVLNDEHDIPYCIVTAVPYLRDRDIRSSGAGESMDSKDANVISGIRAHYNGVAAIAKAKQDELTVTIEHHVHNVPIIATGHLFAAGGSTTADDGVRDLYVGNLGQISAEMFDECFDYVALGHLHVPQRVGGREHIRYSGSPIAMGFGEARQQKLVLLVKFGAETHNVNNEEFMNDSVINSSNLQAEVTPAAGKNNLSSTKNNNDFMDDLFGFEDTSSEKGISSPDSNDHLNDPLSSNHQLLPSFAIDKNPSTDAELLYHDTDRDMQVLSVPIPCFQSLAQVSGDMKTIETTIHRLTQSRSSSEPIWLEITYTGDDIVANLREQIEAIVDGLPCEVLLSKNPTKYNKVLNQEQSSETLQDLNELEVFERCLTLNDVTDTQKISLRDAYEEILHAIHHTDSRAE